jgi:septin family protein
MGCGNTKSAHVVNSTSNPGKTGTIASK